MNPGTFTYEGSTRALCPKAPPDQQQPRHRVPTPGHHHISETLPSSPLKGHCCVPLPGTTTSHPKAPSYHTPFLFPSVG